MGSWYPIVATPNRQPAQWSKCLFFSGFNLDSEKHLGDTIFWKPRNLIQFTQFGIANKPTIAACFDDLQPSPWLPAVTKPISVGLWYAGYAYRTGDSNSALPHRSHLVLDFFSKVWKMFLVTNLKLGGGNSNICQFHPGSFVKWSNLSDSYFSNGLKSWNHQLVNHARQKYEEASKFMHLFLRVDWAGKSLEWPHALRSWWIFE